LRPKNHPASKRKEEKMHITIWGPFNRRKRKKLEKKIKKINWKKARACCHEEEKTDNCAVYYAVMNSVRENRKSIFILVEPSFTFNSTTDAVVSHKLADIVSKNIGGYYVECMIVSERNHLFFSGHRSRFDPF
jgi:hypothetical protein